MRGPYAILYFPLYNRTTSVGYAADRRGKKRIRLQYRRARAHLYIHNTATLQPYLRERDPFGLSFALAFKTGG